MALWFRHGSCTVGLDDGLIRAADFAALMSLQEAAAAVADTHAQVLGAAQAEARECIDAARADAIRLRSEAQAAFEQAHADGLAQGQAQALADWTGQAVAAARAQQAVLERQCERLAGIVAAAVERVVEQEDRQALFRRALRTVSKLVKDVPLLTLRVHGDDRHAAQQAVLALVDQVQADLPIEVVCDASLAEGSCRFESDQGVIDAGLPEQMAAIRRAVLRAAQAGPLVHAE